MLYKNFGVKSIYKLLTAGNHMFIKKFEKCEIFAFITFIFSVTVFIWFSLLCGMQGTFHWHKEGLLIYLIFFILLFSPVALSIINHFKPNKFTHNFLIIISTLGLIFYCTLFLTLSILSSVKINRNGLDILDINSPLPVSEIKQTDKEENLIAHYAFTSDPHWGSSTSNAEARKQILKQIDSNNYDSLFLLGDISEVGIIPGIYKTAIKDLSENLSHTKLRAIPGNHDALINGLPLFKSCFMNKTDKFYFRMDNGTIHFIFLNILWDTAEFSKKQEKWLINQLESIPQEDTVIVISHCYITGSGFWDKFAQRNWGDIPDVINRLCPILEKYNVDLSLSGHNHFFEYLEKENVSYAVLGTMGGKLDENLIYSSPYSKWINNEAFGWLDMKIYDSHLDLTFYEKSGTELYRTQIETK